MDINFRNAVESDIEEIYRFNVNLINKYENINELTIPIENVYEWVRKKIINNISEYKVIYYKGTKVGFFYLHETDGKLELDDLYIFEEYQNKKIGTNVLECCMQEANSRCMDIFLYVFSRNKIAYDLYLKYGFVVVKSINSTRIIMEKKYDRNSK